SPPVSTSGVLDMWHNLPEAYDGKVAQTVAVRTFESWRWTKEPVDPVAYRQARRVRFDMGKALARRNEPAVGAPTWSDASRLARAPEPIRSTTGGSTGIR